MEEGRLGEHFRNCPVCSLPIEDDKYMFSIWICDGKCTTVAVHMTHKGES